MRTTPAPDAAASPAISGSSANAEMSLMIGGARCQCPPRDFGLGRINRDRDLDLRGEGLDDRDDAAQLFVERHGQRARAARFAAEIEQIRSFGDQLRPWPSASSRTEFRPPSEKLSGVRLTIPITFGTGSSADRMVRPQASQRIVRCVFTVRSQRPARTGSRCSAMPLTCRKSLSHRTSSSLNHGCSIMSTICLARLWIT